MIIFTLFVLFLITGFIFEASTLTGKKEDTKLTLPYALGTLLFLFVDRPYIWHLGIELLVIILILNIFADYLGYSKPWVDKVDSYLCLLVLSFIAFHASVNLVFS
jgi:hypothetical protein